MENEIKEVTVITKKRARKYIHGITGKYKAQIIINDVSKDLEVDRVVRLLVKDVSVRKDMGNGRMSTQIIRFEPIEILKDRSGEELRQAAQDLRWLEWAEKDAQEGKSNTNAIKKALWNCTKYDHLAERLEALKLLAKKNNDEWLDMTRNRKVIHYVYGDTEPPTLDTPTILDDQVVVFVYKGKVFEKDGEDIRYFYYRHATSEEIESLKELSHDEL